MPILTIIAHITAKPDQIAFVKSELEKLIEPTRAETGCLLYELHQDDNNPAHFMFYERWESRNRWQAHMNAPHLQSHLAVTKDAIEISSLYEMTLIS